MSVPRTTIGVRTMLGILSIFKILQIVKYKINIIFITSGNAVNYWQFGIHCCGKQLDQVWFESLQQFQWRRFFLKLTDDRRRRDDGRQVMAIAQFLVRWAKNNQIALNNVLLQGEKDINYKRSVLPFVWHRTHFRIYFQIVSRSRNIFLDKNEFQRENRSYFAKRVEISKKINKGSCTWRMVLLFTLKIECVMNCSIINHVEAAATMHSE